MKKVTKVTFICAIVLVVAAVFGTLAVTGAFWNDKTQDTKGTTTDVTKTNGSEKYIVYAMLDASGNLIASDSSDEASAYAVVGYTGLVAELTVPDTVNGKPVTKVLAVSPYSGYKCVTNCTGESAGVPYAGDSDDDARLATNSVVTSIVFGNGVEYIAQGVCTAMEKLATVKFGTGLKLIGAYAFLSCPLTSVTFEEGEWSVADSEENALADADGASVDVSSDGTNASMLTGSYLTKFWYKAE